MNFLLVKSGFNLGDFKSLFRFSTKIVFGLLLFPVMGFSQPTPAPTQISDYVLYGGGGVYIGSSNTVNNGVVGSNTQVVSTGSSMINSSIYSQGIINLSNSNDVSGRIAAADAQNLGGTILYIGSGELGGNIDVNGNIIIGGGTVYGTVTYPEGNSYSGPTPGQVVRGFPTLPAAPIMPKYTTFPSAGSTDVTATQVLTPGSYKNLVLNGKDKITFSGPGIYVFSSITASGNNNSFIFDYQGSDGKIFIYVHGDVDLGKLTSSFVNGGDESRLFAETHGDGLTSKSGKDAWVIANGNGGGSKWSGTIWAPNAGIFIGSGTGSTSMSGALYSGTDININSGVTMNFIPFDFCTIPIINASNDITVCSDNNLVKLEATASGGPGPFSYEWSDGQNVWSGNSIDVNPTTNTTYTVTVTDTSVGGSCVGTDEVLVTVNNNPLVTNSNDRYCSDDAENGILLSIYDGDITTDAGVTVSWYSDAAHTLLVTTVTPTLPADGSTPNAEAISTYYAVATNDATGCTSEAALELVISPDPLVVAGITGEFCADDLPQGTVDLTQYENAVSSGSTFKWYYNIERTSEVVDHTAATIGVPADGGALIETSYYATVTHDYSNGAGASCGTDASIAITVNPDPKVTRAYDRFCADDMQSGWNLSLSDPGITTDPGVTVTWFSDVARTQSITMAYPTLPADGSTPNAEAISIYYAIATNDLTGCTTESEFELVVNPDPLVVAGITGEFCADDLPQGTVNLTQYENAVSTGSEFKWYYNIERTSEVVDHTAATIGVPADGGALIETPYYATVTHDYIDGGNNRCGTDASIVITVNPDPLVANSNDRYCSDDAENGILLSIYDGDITTDAGVTVSWYSDAAHTLLVTTVTPTLPADGSTPNAEAISTYYAVATNDATGCTSEAALELVISPDPLIVAGITGEFCADDLPQGTVNLTQYENAVSSGSAFKWYYNIERTSEVLDHTAATIGVPADGGALIETSYYATVTHDYSNGAGASCGTDASIAITVNPDPKVTRANDRFCADDMRNGWNLSLSDPGITTDPGVTVTWFSDVARTQPITMAYPTLPEDGSTPNAEAISIFYAIATNDLTGCTTESEFEIVVNPDPLVVAGITGEFCADDLPQGTVNLTQYENAVSTGSEFKWFYNIERTSEVVDHTAATIGVPADGGALIETPYYATVTHDYIDGGNNRCSTDATIVISVNSPLSTNVSSDVTFVCPESSTAILSATATGGSGTYSFTWTDDNGQIVATGATISVSPSLATTYTVSVRDIGFAGAVCESSSSIAINYSDICPYYAPTTKVNDLIGSELTSLFQTFGGIGSVTSDFVYQIVGDDVLVDIIVQAGEMTNVLSLLTGTYTLDPVGISINDLIITTFFPIISLDDLNSRSDIINFVRPVFLPISNNTGILTQGDSVQGSEEARRKFKVGGAGVKVGVLSDSYNKYGTVDYEAQDIGSGDLPDDVQVTSSTGDDWDYPYGGSDEGRAMLQIVHDVAPEAKLAFRTGFISESDFAQGIYDLYDDANCDVIVDDITYITEPFYKSGLVAQAIDYVTSSGGTYITSAGNFGTHGYESQFNPLGTDPVRHDFGGGDVLQKISLEQGTYTIVLQWDDFFYSDEPITGGAANPAGAAHDFDIYLADLNGNILFGFNRNNIGGDPIEILPFNVNAPFAEANLVIEKAAGENVPVNLKYVVFRSSTGFTQEYNTGTSTIVGHAANTNAITVAAARYNDISKVESFSSRGSVNSTELGYNKPDITAPDGGNTTVTSFSDYVGTAANPGDDDSSPNFFGTSAAAPHAAGVAALLLDAEAHLGATLPAMKTALAIGAVPIGTIDESGSGLVQADAILESLIAPVGVITDLSYTPEEGTPGTVLITVIIEGNYISSGTEIWVDSVALTTTVTAGPTEGTFILTAEVDTFLGDPDIQVWNPGVGESYDRISEPVSFFEGQTTIIISANINGAEDASKLFGERDPTFNVRLLDANLYELDPTEASAILANLAPYLEFRTSGDADWRLDWIAPNYVIEPYLNDLFTAEQSGPGGMAEIYNFQIENGQLAILPMPLTIAAVDVPQIEYGDPIPISFNYIYNNEQIVNWATQEGAAAMDAELELGYGNGARQNLGILTDMDGIINGGRPLVNGGRPLVNGGRPLVNGGRPLVNGPSFIVTESILNGGRPLVNGLPTALLDEELINTYDDDDSDGILISFTNGGLSLVNGKYIFDGTAKLANGGRPLVNGGGPLVNGNSVDNGGESLVNGGRPLVNGGRPLVNGVEGGDPSIDLLFILHEADIPVEGTAEDPNEINIYPITFISGVESIFNNEVTSEWHHKILPAPFVSENFIVNTVWGDLVIGAKPVTATLAPATSTRIYGADLPPFTTSVVPNDDPNASLPYGEQVVSTSYSLDEINGERAFALPLDAGILADAANYSVEQDVVMPLQFNYDITYVGSTLDVTSRDLVIGITADSKSYDGTTAATTLAAITSGLVDGDDVEVSSTNGQFDTKNIGHGKTVVADVSTAGIDAGNYTANLTAIALADITAKDLSITVTADDRVYDGTTNAVTNASITEGKISTDDVVVTSTDGQFDNKDVGSNKSVSYILSTTGVDVGNYNILDIVTPTASVTAAELSITADNQVKAEGEVDPFLSFQTTGLIDGDEVTGGSLGRDIGEDAGVYTIYDDGLSAGTNYVINYNPGIFYINPDGPGTKKVRTYLDCVEKVPGGKPYSYIANFRYENTNSTDIFVPYGDDNNIFSSTGIFDGSELPELFLSGGDVFSIPFDGERLIWTLASYESDLKTSVSSDASSGSNKCHGNYAMADLGSLTEDTELDMSIADEEFGVSGVKAYPNPVVDRIYIQFKPDAKVDENVAVYDIQGQLHPVNTVWGTAGNELEVDMSGLLKGEYIVRVKINDTYQMIRIVKMQ